MSIRDVDTVQVEQPGSSMIPLLEACLILDNSWGFTEVVLCIESCSSMVITEVVRGY